MIFSFSTLMIVDSTPTLQAPPPKIRGIFPFKSSRTCSALVGLGKPEVLALGAASGLSVISINDRATGCEGILTPTVSKLAVVILEIRLLLGRITVSGPGQKVFIMFSRSLSIFVSTTLSN